MSESEKLVARWLVGVKKENEKFFACLMHPITQAIDYVTPPCDTIEEANADIQAELTLRFAAKGEIIEIRSKPYNKHQQ